MTEPSNTIPSEEAIVEAFHERVAIMEVDAGISQAKAEYEAAMELRRLYGRDNLPMVIRETGNRAYRTLQGLKD